jgi:methyl-accepting chemotaxis protein
MAKAFRRKNYLTKKGFQARFLLPFLLASSLANVATVTLFVVLARNKIDGMLFSMLMPDTSAGALLAPIAFVASLVAVVAVSLLFLWAARGSHHKIAGPLLDIRAGLQKITAGDLISRVALREIDEFKDFAGEINAMVAALNSRFAGLKGLAGEMSAAAGALKSSAKPEEFRAASRSMRGAINAMAEQIRSFDL